ncbi:MAG: hypothetical protein R3A79_12330 [Nannocystaceae bacterium]
MRPRLTASFALTLGLSLISAALPLPTSTASAAERPSEEDPGAEDLAGAYRFKGSAAAKEAKIDAEIDAATENMSGPIRDLARKRLKATNTVPKSVTIEIDGDDCQIDLGDRSIRTRNGRAALHTARDGSTSRVTHQLRGGAVVERLKTPEGLRTNTYRLRDGGDALRVEVRIRSPHLADDVRYSLEFTRTGG